MLWLRKNRRKADEETISLLTRFGIIHHSFIISGYVLGMQRVVSRLACLSGGKAAEERMGVSSKTTFGIRS